MRAILVVMLFSLAGCGPGPQINQAADWPPYRRPPSIPIPATSVIRDDMCSSLYQDALAARDFGSSNQIAADCGMEPAPPQVVRALERKAR